MRLAIIAIGFVSAGLSVSWAQPPSYDLDVAFEPEAGFVRAEASVDFGDEADRFPSTLFLHGELRVTSASIDGEAHDLSGRAVFYPLDYALIARELDLSAEAGRRLALEYEGVFNPSRARAPSDYMRIDADGVFLRGFGYSPWFPVFSDQYSDRAPADFSICVSVPEPFIAVVAGERVSESHADGRHHSCWRADNTMIDNVQITARPFTTISDSGVYVYHLPDADSAQAARSLLDFAAQLLGEFHRMSGRTGTGQTHIVQSPRYADIFSGSVVAVNEADWRAFEVGGFTGQLLAHELSHGFVRPRIAHDDPLFAVVEEGFPSYFDLYALKRLGWVQSYETRVGRLRAAYERGIEAGEDEYGRALPENKPLSSIGSDEIGLYKDRFLLSDRIVLMFDHMARQLGPDDFDRLIHRLLSAPQITRSSFLAEIDQIDAELGADVRVWLDTTEYPDRFQP